MDDVCDGAGQVLFGGECYSFNNQEKSWTEGRKTCMANKGDLAVLQKITAVQAVATLDTR